MIYIFLCTAFVDLVMTRMEFNIVVNYIIVPLNNVLVCRQIPRIRQKAKLIYVLSLY